MVSASPQQCIPRYPTVLQSLSGTCQPMAWWLGSRQAARQGMLSLECPDHREPPTRGVWHAGKGYRSREGSSRDIAVTTAEEALCHKHQAVKSIPRCLLGRRQSHGCCKLPSICLSRNC